MSRFRNPVRSSKYRHIFPQAWKRERCYENIHISRDAHDGCFCAVNPEFLAVVTESAGGGTFIVIPLKKIGRVDVNMARVCGHAGGVTDIKWNPFDDHQIASASEDGTVKIWQIPLGGLRPREDLTRWIVELHGHQKRVSYCEWHPSARDIIATASNDYQVMVWHAGTGQAVTVVCCHTDHILSLSWNLDGSLLATSAKDKLVRILNPRSGACVSQGVAHVGPRGCKVSFLGDLKDRLFTTGFSRYNERQYAIWDINDMTKPLRMENIDSSSGQLFPIYDPDTRVMYLAGKGDGNVRYFEMVPDAPYCHYLAQIQSAQPQRGFGVLPKRGVDVSRNEVMRFFKLHTTQNLCEVISMIVPRKSGGFQEDIYPPSAGLIPALTAEEWLAGVNRDPILVSFKDGRKIESAARIDRSVRTSTPTIQQHKQPQWQPLLTDNNNPKPPSRATQTEPKSPTCAAAGQADLNGFTAHGPIQAKPRPQQLPASVMNIAQNSLTPDQQQSPAGPAPTLKAWTETRWDYFAKKSGSGVRTATGSLANGGSSASGPASPHTPLSLAAPAPAAAAATVVPQTPHPFESRPSSASAGRSHQPINSQLQPQFPSNLGHSHLNGSHPNESLEARPPRPADHRQIHTDPVSRPLVNSRVRDPPAMVAPGSIDDDSGSPDGGRSVSMDERRQAFEMLLSGAAARDSRGYLQRSSTTDSVQSEKCAPTIGTRSLRVKRHASDGEAKLLTRLEERQRERAESPLFIPRSASQQHRRPTARLISERMAALESSAASTNWHTAPQSSPDTNQSLFHQGIVRQGLINGGGEAGAPNSSLPLHVENRFLRRSSEANDSSANYRPSDQHVPPPPQFQVSKSSPMPPATVASTGDAVPGSADKTARRRFISHRNSADFRQKRRTLALGERFGVRSGEPLTNGNSPSRESSDSSDSPPPPPAQFIQQPSARVSTVGYDSDGTISGAPTEREPYRCARAAVGAVSRQRFSGVRQFWEDSDTTTTTTTTSTADNVKAVSTPVGPQHRSDIPSVQPSHVKRGSWSRSSSVDAESAELHPTGDSELRKAYFQQQTEIQSLKEQLVLKDKRLRSLEDEVSHLKSLLNANNESTC